MAINQMFRVKERKTDKLFSLYVRTRDKWTCQKCGKQHPVGSGSLATSHYFSRRHENTRFDPDNGIALCNIPCHLFQWGHGEGRVEYKEFMVKKLGQGGFDFLEFRSNQYCKRDDKLMEFILTEMLKEVKNAQE